MVHDCMVAWYRRDDTYYFESSQNSCEQFEHIVAGVDLIKMLQDSAYLRYAIKGIPEQQTEGLFNKERVQRYLKTGLKTEEEISEEINRTGNKRLWLCGRYVGEIVQKENGSLSKKFNLNVGKLEHNSPEMAQERLRHREEEYRKQQSIKEAKKAYIANERKRLAELEAAMEEDGK